MRPERREVWGRYATQKQAERGKRAQRDSANIRWEVKRDDEWGASAWVLLKIYRAVL